MAVMYDGNGVTFTRSGLTLEPKKITLPGMTQEKIEVSYLTNTTVKTYVMGALSEYNDIGLSVQFDAAQYNSLSAGNAEMVINFPNSGGTITLWANLAEIGDVEYENHVEPIYELKFCVTNRNGSGVETPPVYSA